VKARRSTVARFLKDRLPPHMYERLSGASAGFTRPLFAKDPQSGRFEFILDGDTADGDDLLVDAACTACDLLSESGLEFPHDRLVAADGDEKGEISLEFLFGEGEAPAYELFRKLLLDAGRRDTGLKARAEKLPGGYRVAVSIRYVSDFDYQRKKDSIDWMLHLARKKANDSPFSGRRI